MRIEQSADDMMKTPVPIVAASIDLTHNPPLVIERVNHVNKLNEPRYLDKILNKKINDEIKMSYYLKPEILKHEMLLLSEILFTPKNTCFNISVEIIDRAPLRTAMNTDIHGYFVWGSKAISYWQSSIANNNYYIIRKPYNIEVYDEYIIFGKTEKWIVEVRNKLSAIPINEIYLRKILVVEGEEYINKDLVFTQEVKEIDRKILEAITFNIGSERIRKMLIDYIMHLHNNVKQGYTIDNDNVFIGLGKLYGIEKMKILISKLLMSCQQTIINEDELFRILPLELGLTKSVLRKLFGKNKKVVVTTSHDSIVVEGIYGSSIVELEVAGNDCTSKHVLLVDEKHKVTITIPLRRISKHIIRYRTY